MNDGQDELRDRLAADAEAYAAGSPHGSTVDSDFEIENPGLAKTLRMLQAVFLPAADLKFDDNAIRSEMGRFAIKSRLGTGNFGSVWLAHDPLLKRDVAIKVAHVGIHSRADLQERFEREGHLAARLHHPNIVPVFETGVDHERMFIVSEYSPGPSLDRWLGEHLGPVDPILAAGLVRQLADAADHAHRQGLIHRDIKPANVLLTIPSGDAVDSTIVPRLTDFGLARDLTCDTSATQTGMMLGTVGYMSPEQARGELHAQGPASDIFSLGVLLYRLMTGATPFSGETDFETVQQIIRSEPLAPDRHAPRVPRDLSSICLKCLEKQPARRYATAADLRDDLDRYLRGEPTFARPISNVERLSRWTRRRPAAALLVVVLFGSLAIATGAMGVYLRVVERHSRELAVALREARDERETANEQRERAREISYRADMRLAFDLRERGQVHPVKEILARQQPSGGVDLRGPEWFVLNAELKAKYREIGHHEGAVTECVVSRDQRTAFTTGVDGFLRVWDVPSGQAIRSFQPGIGELHALALSPDESVIAVGGQTWIRDRASVLMLDAKTGMTRQTWQSHETTIESIALSPDGKWLAAGSRYQPVQLTRLADGVEFTLDSDRRNRRVSFSSDSRLLSITPRESHVTIWQLDGEVPARLSDIPGFAGQTPYISRFAPNASLLATTYVSGPFDVSLFEPASHDLCGIAMAGNIHNSPAALTSVGFSHDARRLAAGDAAGTVLLWEPDPERFHHSARFYPIAIAAPHVARVTSVVVTKESSLVSSGEDGRVARTTPFATGATHVRWNGLLANAAVLNGDELLLACEDGAIHRHMFDAATQLKHRACAPEAIVELRDAPQVILRETSPIRSLAVSANQKLLATGTLDGGVRIYRRETGELARCLVKGQPTADEVCTRAVAFSSNGDFLASTGDDGYLKVWNIATGEERLSQHVGNGWSVAFLPGDRFVACGGRFERIHIFDLTTGKMSRTLPGTETTSINVIDDGYLILSSHMNGNVQILDTRTGNHSRVITGHRGACESVTRSSNNRSVISLDNQGVVQFADVATGAVFGKVQLPERPKGSLPTFQSVQCSPTLLAGIVAYRDSNFTDLFVWQIR